MKPRDLPLSAALTSPLASGPLDWIVTLRLSPWILGLAFLGLPRLAQAQDVTSGTAIYGTGQAATNWTGGTISSGATLRLDNGGTVSGNATNNGTFQYNKSENLTINNTITGSGTLTKDGAGTLTLTQRSDFKGGLAVNAGTVRLLTSNLKALWEVGEVSIASGAVLTTDQTTDNHHHIGRLTLNGGTLTSINGPAGQANDSDYGNFFLQEYVPGAGGVVVGGSSMSTISASTVGFSNGSFNVGDVAVGTDLLVSSRLIPSGTGSLIKTGVGTMTLTGVNSYTTATTISAGTLEVSGASGALTATSAVNISGGTLSLSGSAANRISNTASISLGAAGSTLQLSGAVIETLGAMTLAGGVGARVIDFGVTSGVLTLASLSAASNLPLHIWNWSGTTGTGGGTDQLVISSGFLEGSLAASNVSFFSGSGTGLYSGATTFTASGGELVPSVSVAVPEPGTFFPAAVLVAAAFLRRRRGRGRATRA
jgi:MYXO-CTERM domain-containing protein